MRLGEIDGKSVTHSMNLTYIKPHQTSDVKIFINRPINTL
jgi:hypothetical protein